MFLNLLSSVVSGFLNITIRKKKACFEASLEYVFTAENFIVS